MELTESGRSLGHLTYCSNIHAGESWSEVEANLKSHVPGIRDALSPDAPFGIGLRLSGVATAELASTAQLEALRTFLDEQRCYVFTLNGFPYGPFHGTRVKEEVYLPDWQDSERLRYTNQLADVLAALLPKGQTGSISTVPGAFKSRVSDETAVRLMARHMVEHVSHLVQIERTSGASIVLALEPEPCCFLETIAETIDFFEQYLFAAHSVSQLAAAVNVDASTAETLLRKHLTVCLDLCHAAIEFEDADGCFDALANAGIAIGKLQISAGLRLQNVTPTSAEALRPFVDATYLHQVVERHDGALTRHVDLPEAFAHLHKNGEPNDSKPREWRVHFHVPIFLDDLGDFSSTQFFIRQALERHLRQPVSAHLEVETYTWNVLPERYRTESVDAAIVRELSWARDALCG